MSKVELYCGDCLDIMPTLPAQSVDAIITDLPYGTTACAWDEVIPFAPMWEEVKRLLKPRGVFVTTASQPFTSKLVMSNLDWFKYEWIWKKNEGSRFLDAKWRPLLYHENIEVFSDGKPFYIPQKTKVPVRFVTRTGKADHYNDYQILNTSNNGENYPRTVLEFNRESNGHPTQKPIELYEYLILTYTNPGAVVLDICAGSGTTGVAAILTGRDAVLIEKDPGYYAIAQRRIAAAQMQPPLFEG